MTSAIMGAYPDRLVILLFGVCLSVAVGSATAGPADTGGGDIARGAASWGQNCARCHEMRDPEEFRDDLWKPIVAHMRVRAGLTGQQQRDILAFLQASNNPAPAKVPATSAIDATTGSALSSGKAIYERTCVACHGTDGTGNVPGAPDFTAADGPLSKPDEILVRHVTDGFQSPGSALAMPAKGGNPALGENDIRAVVGYLRESFGR
jgi:cytochrome c5